MLDVRRFRTEFDVVRAGLARRGDDLRRVDRVARLDERAARLAAERDELRAGDPPDLQRGRAAAPRRRKDEAAELQDESRALGDRGEGARRARPRRLAEELRDAAAAHPQPPGRRRARRRRRGTTTSWSGSRASTPDGYAEHQRVPHWEIGERARHPRPGARRQASPARCSRCSGAPGATLRRGRCASSRSTATPTPTRRSARRRWCAPTR